MYGQVNYFKLLNFEVISYKAIILKKLLVSAPYKSPSVCFIFIKSCQREEKIADLWLKE